MKDAVVVGAGPYGLSTVAHLRAAGVEPYIVGQPMSFWKRHMPRKMLLRSDIEASNIAAPGKHLSIVHHLEKTGKKLEDPLPIEDFIAYGEWFQEQQAPELDTRCVRRISQTGKAFELTFEDLDRIQTRSVVLALGIGPFCYRPDQFTNIPRELAPHSSDINEPSQFSGQRIAVIGKGQSALECAALLHENNADVFILTRGSGINYFKFKWKKHLFRALTPGPLRPFSHYVLPPTDLGGFRKGRKMAHPWKFRREPPESQEALLNIARQPIGAYWLIPRLRNVPVRTSISVNGVDLIKDGLRLTLSDGTTESVNRVILATGYKIDVSKYHILDPSLRQQVQTSDGYPVLSTGLQTSVDGLYMAGVVAERTLGPTLRFVVGTSNAGPRLAAAITGRTS